MPVLQSFFLLFYYLNVIAEKCQSCYSIAFPNSYLLRSKVDQKTICKNSNLLSHKFMNIYNMNDLT